MILQLMHSGLIEALTFILYRRHTGLANCPVILNLIQDPPTTFPAITI